MKLRRNHRRNQTRNRETTSLGRGTTVSPPSRARIHGKTVAIGIASPSGFARRGLYPATSTSTSRIGRQTSRGARKEHFTGACALSRQNAPYRLRRAIVGHLTPASRIDYPCTLARKPLSACAKHGAGASTSAFRQPGCRLTRLGDPLCARPASISDLNRGRAETGLEPFDFTKRHGGGGNPGSSHHVRSSPCFAARPSKFGRGALLRISNPTKSDTQKQIAANRERFS